MLARISSRLTAYQNCHCILESEETNGPLYLGDYTAAIDQTLLKQKGIKTVLTVAIGLPVSYNSSSGIFQKMYPALDIESYNISKFFPDTYNQIDEGLKRGGVLVHCAAGVSRSAATTIAYLMKKFDWSYTKSYSYVRSKRPVICPNFGFVRQLKTFEKTLKVSQPEKNDQQNNYTSGQKQNENEEQKFNQTVQKPQQQKQFSKSLPRHFNKNAKPYNSQNTFEKTIKMPEIVLAPNIMTYAPNNELIKKRTLPKYNFQKK